MGQRHDNPVRPCGPFPGRVREPLRLAGQPVPAGDRQEPVRGGQPRLLPTVPGVPLRGEVIDGGDCFADWCGHICAPPWLAFHYPERPVLTPYAPTGLSIACPLKELLLSVYGVY